MCLQVNQTSGEDGKSENIRCPGYCFVWEKSIIAMASRRVRKNLNSKETLEAMQEQVSECSFRLS